MRTVFENIMKLDYKTKLITTFLIYEYKNSQSYVCGSGEVKSTTFRMVVALLMGSYIIILLIQYSFRA